MIHPKDTGYPHDVLYVNVSEDLEKALKELREATDNLRKANSMLDEINKAQEENLALLKEIINDVKLAL